MRTAAASSEILRFGTFEVDLRSGELRRSGVKIKLQEHSFRVLVSLLNQTGDVVTREQLRRELWPDDTFVDFDNGLNTAVARLREALNDSAERPRFIETLPRRGYRFIKEPAAPIETKSHSQKKWGHYLIWGFLAALVLFGLYAGLRNANLFHGGSRRHIRSLAVLPMTNISGEPEQDMLADGMTEELITELSRIGSVRVVSRTSVMQYKRETKPVPEIGRELNVDAVIEGSVLRVGNRVRIEAHMIDAPTDQSLMAETYDGDLHDILKIQREVAQSVAEKIRVKLTPEERSRLREAPKVAPEAYQAFLEGTYTDNSGYQGILTSQRYFSKAIEADPSFARAYAYLAMTYTLLGLQHWQSPSESFPKAKQAASKAVELDPNDCTAQVVLARIIWQYDWDWQLAEKAYRHAVELCPGDPGIHLEFSAYAATSDRIDEARAELSKARELDPLGPEFFVCEAVINYHQRDYKALAEISRAFVARSSNDWLAHYWLGVGYQGLGQTPLAVVEYQKAVELSQGDSDPTTALAYAYATTGKKEKAQKILSDWLGQSKTRYVSPYMIAALYAGLGNKDRAFEYLERAFAERSPDLTYFLRTDLRLDSLRADQRYADLVHRMEFPH